jgi:hypothetical protein
MWCVWCLSVYVCPCSRPAVCLIHAILRPRNTKSRVVRSFLGMKVWFKKNTTGSDSDDDDQDAEQPRGDDDAEVHVR